MCNWSSPLRKLRKAFESRPEAIRLYGEAIGKKYVMALMLVKQARSLEELFLIPQLRFHPLKGDRYGEYSATLTGNWRVIITFPAEDIARIEKVEDYHGR